MLEKRVKDGPIEACEVCSQLVHVQRSNYANQSAKNVR